MTGAFLGALAAFVFGLNLGSGLVRHLASLYAGTVVAGACLLGAFVWNRRVVRRIAASEADRNHARQFQWSCLFFAMISGGFGIAVASLICYGSDFLRTFGVVFWGLIVCVGIYPVRRDAKRFAGSA
jgi:hypothetical protein